MLVYNTTFHVYYEVEKNFVIWIQESYIPEIIQGGLLKSPRFMRVLSRHNDEGESYSMQWEVESSGLLHRWHTETGVRMNGEIGRIFKNKVVGFPTLLEIVE
ncbi:MAG: DUF4286 family protein [Bacteroides sp.]|nr:DUF4286 family protein [Bacteroides sp.]